VDVGLTAVLNKRGNALLEQREQRPLDEIRLCINTGLPFKQSVILVEVLSYCGWPRREIAGEKPRAPATPIQRFSADTVRLTDKIDVAAPRDPPN
jgi:hypothetical protein